MLHLSYAVSSDCGHTWDCDQLVPFLFTSVPLPCTAHLMRVHPHVLASLPLSVLARSLASLPVRVLVCTLVRSPASLLTRPLANILARSLASLLVWFLDSLLTRSLSSLRGVAGSVVAWHVLPIADVVAGLGLDVGAVVGVVLVGLCRWSRSSWCGSWPAS